VSSFDFFIMIFALSSRLSCKEEEEKSLSATRRTPISKCAVFLPHAHPHTPLSIFRYTCCNSTCIAKCCLLCHIIIIYIYIRHVHPTTESFSRESRARAAVLRRACAVEALSKFKESMLQSYQHIPGNPDTPAKQGHH
jgi:hypothetical protein